MEVTVWEWLFLPLWLYCLYGTMNSVLRFIPCPLRQLWAFVLSPFRLLQSCIPLNYDYFDTFAFFILPDTRLWINCWSFFLLLNDNSYWTSNWRTRRLPEPNSQWSISQLCWLKLLKKLFGKQHSHLLCWLCIISLSVICNGSIVNRK